MDIERVDNGSQILNRARSAGTQRAINERQRLANRYTNGSLLLEDYLTRVSKTVGMYRISQQAINEMNAGAAANDIPDDVLVDSDSESDDFEENPSQDLPQQLQEPSARAATRTRTRPSATATAPAASAPAEAAAGAPAAPATATVEAAQDGAAGAPAGLDQDEAAAEDLMNVDDDDLPPGIQIVEMVVPVVPVVPAPEPEPVAEPEPEPVAEPEPEPVPEPSQSQALEPHPAAVAAATQAGPPIPEEFRCKVCLQHDRNIDKYMVKECSHLYVCENCMPHIVARGTCMVCRGPFTELVKLFF